MRPDRLLRMSYLVAGVAGVGFFGMSVLLLGVWPSRVLEEAIESQSPGPALALTASEQRGRRVYSREGCAYCHTQQIRYLAADVVRFGAATLAWETNLDFPHLWGTRRIGPDLSREAGVRSADWQRAHLFAPRALVPDSVMPAFPHLFDGAPGRPTRDGADLLAYLETLGRARELAGEEGEQHARNACSSCDEETRRFAFEAPALNTHPAKPRRTGPSPALEPAAVTARGRELYARHCAGCHGPDGRGSGPGAALLDIRPANFAEHNYTLEGLSRALWLGVDGTAMPAWRDLPLQDLSALAAVVRSFSLPQPPAEISALGRTVYAAHCAQCHGEQGAGDGFGASQFEVPPTNFREQRPSPEAALRAVRDGIPGTPMAPWALKLSDAEVSAAAQFVRGFYQGGQ
jgi:mono/diheme cytochrome c family protein